jgi:hypothetical protein
LRPRSSAPGFAALRAGRDIVREHFPELLIDDLVDQQRRADRTDLVVAMVAVQGDATCKASAIAPSERSQTR